MQHLLAIFLSSVTHAEKECLPPKFRYAHHISEPTTVPKITQFDFDMWAPPTTLNGLSAFLYHLFSNLHGTHSSEGKGNRGKGAGDHARTRDLRSIAEFQPREPQRPAEILHPPSPLCTGVIVPLTDEGSWKLPKRLRCFGTLASVNESKHVWTS